MLDLVSLPCHVVLTCHIADEKKTDPLTKQQYETGKTISDTLGNFRKEVAGLFNASIYLKVRKDSAGYHYLARCLPGEQMDAKNNLGLPELVENISYQTLVQALPRLT